MISRAEAVKFLNEECVMEAIGPGRILVFHGVVKECGPSGVLVDNGRQRAVVAYDDIIKIRVRGDDRA